MPFDADKIGEEVLGGEDKGGWMVLEVVVELSILFTEGRSLKFFEWRMIMSKKVIDFNDLFC